MRLNQIVKDKDSFQQLLARAACGARMGTLTCTAQNGYLTSFMYVARAAYHDLTGAWEYYGPNGWSTTPVKYNVCNDITQPNVFYKDGKYYLVSQQTLFGLDIYILESSTPVGPLD